MEDGVGAVLARHQIHLEPVARQPVGRRRPDDAQLHALELAQIVRRPQQPVDERIDGVRARENDPVERAGPGARLVERTVVVGRHNPDHRRFDRLGAHRLDELDQLGRLLARTRDEDAPAKQGPRVEPAQMLAERRDAAHHQNRRTAVGRLLHRACDLLERTEHRLLRRQRAVVDQRRGIPGRPSARQQRAQDVRQLLRPRVADNRAVETREARPVHRNVRLAIVLVAADERQGVAAAGIRDRDTGVARHADAGGDPRHDLEAQTLFVQEQRFRSPAIEHERVAPLQARDRFPFARFFREQVANGFLLEWLRSGETHVDSLRV